MTDLHQFFALKHFIETQSPNAYNNLQLGHRIVSNTFDEEEIALADVVIVGCGEWRGHAQSAAYSHGPDAVREEFYQLYAWHDDLRIVDLGNILEGHAVEDTYAALRLVLSELKKLNKNVLLIGGSHDLMMQQYEVFRKAEEVVTITGVDMLIDLDDQERLSDRSFLMEMLSSDPNFVKHYNHIGFQSYFVNPDLLQTLDKLRFDFTRLGKAREQIEEMEPSIRSAQLFGFDINAVKHSDAPANILGSPNGFTGEEACALMQYAGMAGELSSIGLFGYLPEQDHHRLTAKQMAQMLWYFLDGLNLRKQEMPLNNHSGFSEYHVQFTSNDTLFKRSHKTGRWWMQMPDGSFIPCSYNDYLMACRDEIPERWYRENERLV